jgi:hypothetical protein
MLILKTPHISKSTLTVGSLSGSFMLKLLPSRPLGQIQYFLEYPAPMNKPCSPFFKKYKIYKKNLFIEIVKYTC